MSVTDFKRTFTLKQQTPMIHFQSNEEGATLRASEVKPKLDRFLLTCLGGADLGGADLGGADLGGGGFDVDDYIKGVEEARRRKWLVGDGEHPALNYKMRFIAHGTPEKSDEIEAAIRSIETRPRVRPKIPVGSSYFGNMAQFDRNDTPEQKKEKIMAAYKETVFYKQDTPFKPNNPEAAKLSMVIFCYNAELLDMIDKHVAGFFLLHNFGTRQNKGFGSFTVTHRDSVELRYRVDDEISAYFPRTFYYTERQIDSLACVNGLYRLLKSGVNQRGEPYRRSFLYEYLHNMKQPIGNEKAWMKQNGIAPVRGKDVNLSKHENKRQGHLRDFRYVRAMLGLCDNVSYLEKVDPVTGVSDPKYRTTVRIAHCDKIIERYASPITFKVIESHIYILPYPVNKQMLKQRFHFKSKSGSGDIKTPDVFDIDALMLAFEDYVNRINKSDELSRPRSITPLRGKLSHRHRGVNT